MKNSTVILLILALVAAIAAFFYLKNKRKNSTSSPANSNLAPTVTFQADTPAPPPSNEASGLDLVEDIVQEYVEDFVEADLNRIRNSNESSAVKFAQERALLQNYKQRAFTSLMANQATLNRMPQGFYLDFENGEIVVKTANSGNRIIDLSKAI